MLLFKNNAYSSLAASINDVAVSLTVATGHGDRFPEVVNPNFLLITLQDASNNIEIVKVTSRMGGADTMTIERAQEGTTARSWNLGDIVELRVTAHGLQPLQVFAGADTAQEMRDAMAVPSRTGDDASGTWGISISGLAATATALATPRAINGTAFDGSADITTAKWGVSRDIAIGPSTKSWDGSGDVAFTHEDIDVPSRTGTGASGEWPIDISGHAATATSAASAATAAAAGIAADVDDNIITLAKLTDEVINRLFPTGALIPFTGTTVPAAFIEANGAELLRASYPELWAFAQASGNLAVSQGAKQLGQYGPGNGTTTFTIPDVRGEGLRFWDHGKGVDSGRAMGSWQDSQNKAHRHPMDYALHQPGGSYVNRAARATTDATSAGSAGGETVGMGLEGGSEARMRNVAAMAILKI